MLFILKRKKYISNHANNQQQGNKEKNNVDTIIINIFIYLSSLYIRNVLHTIMVMIVYIHRKKVG